jgi:hypothetical protein
MIGSGAFAVYAGLRQLAAYPDYRGHWNQEGCVIPYRAFGQYRERPC